MDKEDLIFEVAILQSKARCGQSVYMDGSHNPTEREWREAVYLVNQFFKERGLE